jgi:crotonobetainyl-CoA:carnitine CoA-transferase CaiB-like acyl-CoA transferase
MLAGPAAAQLLGDQGADVIKVETLGGDPVRGGMKDQVTGAQFSVINRNKRSISLNLKTDEGLAVLRKLVATADVLLQNFRPGVVDRLGISYEDVQKIQPDIVYCSSSGYGQTGPYSERPVYDPVIQATAGLASIQADETGRPKLMRIIVPDKLTAMTSAQAISSALVQKALTGRGSHIHIAMLDAVVAWSWPEAFQEFTFNRNGDADFTEGSGHVPDIPYVRDLIYGPTTDGGYLTIAGNFDKEWERLCTALGREEWVTDPRFATLSARAKNKGTRLQLVDDWVQGMTEKGAVERLLANDVGFAVVNHPRHRVLTDPQVVHNQIVVEYDHPHTPTGKLRQARPAAVFLGQPFGVWENAPTLGQHTAELMAELGFAEAEVEGMHAKGAVRVGVPQRGDGRVRRQGGL